MCPAVEFYVEPSLVVCCLLDRDRQGPLLGDPDNSLS